MLRDAKFFVLGFAAAIAGVVYAQTRILELEVVTNAEFQGTGVTPADSAINMESSLPVMVLYETDQAADEGQWFLDVSNANFNIATRTDAGGAGVNAMQLQRGTGTALAGATIGGIDVFPETGTFTVTLATACTTTPNGTATYAKMGNIVSIELPSISCTSNSTLFTTTTDSPSSIHPTTQQEALTGITNNGTVGEGCAVLSTSGSISFSIRGDCSLGTWTASGTKAMHNTTITYLIN